MNRLGVAPKTSIFDVPATNKWLNTVGDRFSIYSGAANPTVAEVPENQWVVYKNTTTNQTSVWANQAGVLMRTPLVTGPIAFSAYANAAQTVTSGVMTKVQINTEVFDTAGYFDSATNYRFTPLVAGYYQVNGVVRITATTARIDIVELWKNGAAYGRGEEVSITATSTSQVVVSEVVYMNGTSDYLELYGFSNGTTPQFLSAATSATSRFSAALISPP